MAGVTATAKQRRQQQRASVIHELRDVAYYCTQLDPTHTRNHVSPFARAIVWHNHDDDVSILYNYIKYIIFLPISLAANFYFSILIRRVLFAPIYLHIGRRGGTENHVNLFGFFFSGFSPQFLPTYCEVFFARAGYTDRGHQPEKSGANPCATSSPATDRPTANTTAFRSSARWTETTVIAGVNFI